MSQDLFLGDIDPVTGISLGELGFSFKSIGKAIGKVTKPLVKTVGKVASVASVVGIPGAGFADKALNSKLGKKITATTKKVEAVKKAVAPPKPPPKPPAKPAINLVSSRAGSRQGSGSLFADVKSGSSSTAPSTRRIDPKKFIVRPSTKQPDFSDVKSGSSTTVKPSVLKTQATNAGLSFKRRAKASGGTEVVAVNSEGAVVSEPIPSAVLKRAAVPVAEEILPVDAVQAAPPAIPSYSSAASAASFAPSESGSGVAPYSEGDSVPVSGGLFGNPIVLIGGGLIAALVLSRK